MIRCIGKQDRVCVEAWKVNERVDGSAWVSLADSHIGFAWVKSVGGPPLMEFSIASVTPSHGIQHLTNASSTLHNGMSHNYLMHACVCASHRILQFYYSYCSLI